jgi:hypothetical protein
VDRVNTTAPLDAVLKRLDGVRRVGADRYVARCPGHPDRRASLSIARGDDDRLLLHDFAGCTTERILTALQMTWIDLFPLPQHGHRPAPVVSDYDSICRELVARERRLAERRQQWSEVTALAEESKQVHRLIASARRIVTALGPDDNNAWELAERIADLERAMLNAEAGAHLAVAGRSLW